MGLWKIDNVSREEWQRRMMRRHHIHQWLILIGQLILIAGVLLMVIWLSKEVHP